MKGNFNTPVESWCLFVFLWWSRFCAFFLCSSYFTYAFSTTSCIVYFVGIFICFFVKFPVANVISSSFHKLSFHISSSIIIYSSFFHFTPISHITLITNKPLLHRNFLQIIHYRRFSGINRVIRVKGVLVFFTQPFQMTLH